MPTYTLAVPPILRRRASLAFLAITCTLLFLIFPWITSTVNPATTAQFNKSKAQDLQSHHLSTRVVLSLTSFGGRVENINETLASLVAQSRTPDAIYLIVPSEPIHRVDEKSTTSVSDEFLKGLEAGFAPLLTVLRTEDWGPATKLLGALTVEKDPNTIVVTVDDDSTYHPDMLLGLVMASHEHPNNAASYVCEFQPWWAWIIDRGLAIRQWWEGPCKGWANAFKGVAYRVGWFGEEMWDWSRAPKGCKLHDDVWISGNLYRKGIRPWVAVPPFDPLVAHRRHPTLSINAVKDTESAYRNPCLEYFGHFA
ncbi:uncharacterized protein SPPG_09304 [Spizellomyces punctatus DAOM BR117]|uniref:Uncharacterized protein n=1 Tax=Spizellomyces punctatus (strain DAOM BR117) TaxID=645134 RepID=A0A0L0HCW4_SPIPD|nr:uncharacterized protein SPPG_09304 [Spizellomyces punctatus DAOM BR117]KNC98774.1 hypothetical protein SPPG_09304 [Spizellomyces punctatus DAOM BR117]|eukprot:XP_016606814.1 hypothetical protein SPPG_09304 [Spizellomyces punctatus DAOM BR117]